MKVMSVNRTVTEIWTACMQGDMHGKRGIWSHFLTPIKVNILKSVDPAVVEEQCPAVLSSNVPEIDHHDQETQSKVAHPKGVELDRIC